MLHYLGFKLSTSRLNLVTLLLMQPYTRLECTLSLTLLLFLLLLWYFCYCMRYDTSWFLCCFCWDISCAASALIFLLIHSSFLRLYSAFTPLACIIPAWFYMLFDILDTAFCLDALESCDYIFIELLSSIQEPEILQIHRYLSEMLIIPHGARSNRKHIIQNAFKINLVMFNFQFP